MNVDAIRGVALEPAGVRAPANPAAASFGDALALALDGAASALESADGRAGAVAMGTGDVVDASIARAKADVALEIVSVTASRVSGAVNTLLQTQV